MSKTTTTTNVSYEDALKFAEDEQLKTVRKCTTVISKYQQALGKSRNQTKMVATELIREKNAHNETRIQLERATTRTGGAILKPSSEDFDARADSMLASTVAALGFEDDPEINEMLSKLLPK